MDEVSRVLAVIDAAEAEAPISAGEPTETESRIEGGEAPATSETARRMPRTMGYSVDKMNERHALVLIGSKSVVMDENPTAPIEEKHTFRTREAFEAWYANKPTEIVDTEGKIKTVTWARRWWTDKDRRQYSGVCFFPNPDGATAPRGYYNLWQGYSVEPRRGGSYALFRDHMLTNVCEGDERLYLWLFGFFAHIVQRPRERLGISLVMRGKQGVGKTYIGDIFGSLIAAHYFLVDDPRYVTGNFNAHMASCLLLQAEEAVWAGDKVAAGRLKGMITSKMQMIENKGIDPIRLENYVCVIMTSNEGWVVPAGKDERRFAVFDVSDRCKENHEYFGEMAEELDEGGREALLADLLDFDLSSVNLRVIPKTKALLEQKIHTFSPVESWWFERLMEGTTRLKAVEWETEVSRQDLFADYLEKSDKVGIKRRAQETELGMELRKLCPAAQEARIRRMGPTGTERPRVWRFPPLDVCREAFEAAVGQEIDWADETVTESRVGGGEGWRSNLDG